MRIYELKDDLGDVRGFEVDNALLSRGQACRLVASIPGSVLVRRSRLFRDSDDFCEFMIAGDAYIIEEPFGDNSRYWVGPKEPTRSSSLAAVRQVFESHKISETPLRVLLVAALLALGTFGYQRFGRFVEQDRCLDSGGRWVAFERTCSHLPK